MIPARSVVLSDEDTGDDVYFVLSGTARAATFTDDGKEVLLSDITEGEGFGLFAAIDGQPRSTNVVAVTECRAARITARAFQAAMEEEHAIARAVMQYLVGAIRSLSTRVTLVATRNAEQRLAGELLRLAGAETDDAEAVLDPLPTQQELAALIFSQREAVGREMSRLRDLGLIERSGRRLTLLDVPALRAR
ncbi:MAG: Crp/Fnr family transcriptional regulator, partial [Pseudomonadota bacterium]